MTALSVNLNKIALLRNARGRDYPNVVAYGQQLIDLGVQGLTVHPRQDERHATRQDVRDLVELTSKYPDVEFNVEGYPSGDFMALIEATRPDQCTLVPDGPDQITSDHGWDVRTHQALLKGLCNDLREWGVRSSIFLDPDASLVPDAVATGVDRIELYTEAYAVAHAQGREDEVLSAYLAAAQQAQALGLGVNAGHDLDLENLQKFLTIPGVLEVSIGHALTVESLQLGVGEVVGRYLRICDPQRAIT